MSKEIKNLIFNGTMSNFEMVNPEFAKVKVYVCYAGKNRNRSEISREVLDEMAKTIYGIPVVAEYDEVNNCFKGHGGKLEVSDEGIDFIQTTVPYGFVDPTTPVFYEKVKELDGITENEYLCCYAYLWYKRYPEVEKVLRNQENKTIGQSMEIMLDDYEWSEEDYCVVKKGHFTGLAMLGVEPCFESSKVTSKFSLDDVKAQYQEMMEVFKKYTLENFEEGGDIVKDKKIRKCCKCETEIETEQEFNESEEFTCENCSTKEFTKNNFELSHNDIREKLREGLYSSEEGDNWIWVMDVYDDHFMYEIENWEECVTKYYKRSYSRTEEGIVLGSDRIEVFVKYITQEEIDLIEAEKASFEQENSNLKAKFVDIQSEFEVAKEELETLREFKANIDKEIKDNEIEETIGDYSVLSNIEGYEDIYNSRYELSLKDLEDKFKVFAYDNGIIINKKASKKDQKKTVKFQLDNVKKETESSEWDFLSKYKN